MVKKTFFIALLTLLSLTSVVFLRAGEFAASVSSTQVTLNEDFILSLTLKDASPKVAPTVSSLKEHFSIHSQQHSTSKRNINGIATSSITWKLSLAPNKEGSLQIPSITVDTEEGLLSTEPITLNVVKNASLPGSSVDSAGLNVIAKVSNVSPYKNEPFIYTAFLTSKVPLYNVQTHKMQVKDAIVELLGEPKLEKRVIDGVLLYAVEFSYLITPLKAGPLTIPFVPIQGATPQEKKRQSGSFFHDDLDFFSLMQGFDYLKPFTLMAEEVELDVQPAISEVSPWLPAQGLTIEELWPSDQALRVGEPFSRGFQIKAEGLKPSQLPDLKDLQIQNSAFKVYADKAEEHENVLQGVIHSSRKEQYTFIPQQAGAWILPEISISWWDSVKKEKRASTIPSRTIQILPALEAAASPLESSSTHTNIDAPEVALSPATPPFLLYGIIGALTFFLIVALAWGLALQGKIASLTKDPSQKPVKPVVAKPKKPVSPPATEGQKENKEKLPDLNPT